MDTSTALEASPSSSPSSSSSSSSSPYDVFMSFSEDTRKTFTDHLYWTMKDAGIDFFMEENESIRREENISDKVKQIIEGSKVSVIVFSSRYADSIWCLEELVQIMECRRTLKQMVLPIFYDLSPSDVIGTFVLAFQKHRERFHEDTDIQEKLRRWTCALTAAAGLTVWTDDLTAAAGLTVWTDAFTAAAGLTVRVFRTTNGYEGMFIRAIIDEITKLLQSPTPIEIAFTDSAKSPLSTLPGKLPGTGSASGSGEYHCSNSKRRNGPGQYPGSVAGH
ncbi:TMV resistance protein N isoform X3 [Pyrus x bretschneideri]|uniref:TMV resistance protein N isoform X3 n=1 Tax=Pyrus x bretschneideri TaxID=225117 RepID=UPI00202EF9A2|nr:TMV resistance protein N isoform X3 [Pyrus x bretschneideri]